MQIKAYVHAEIDSSYDGKKGHVEQRALVVADHSDGERLLQMLEVPTSHESFAGTSGKLNGKVITITVGEIGNIFGGRVRLNRCKLEKAA